MAVALSAVLAVTLGIAVDQPEQAAASPAQQEQVPQEPLQRPDEAAALLTARMTGRPVTITDATTETTEFVAHPNGTVESTMHTAPVRMKVNDKWIPVDLTLRRDADGFVRPIAHPEGLTISGLRSQTSGPLATIGAGTSQISMGWSGALPEPELHGTRATYREIMPGVDLAVEATRRGFEQFVVVKSREAARHVAQISLPVTGASLASHTRDAAGTVTFKDAAGRAIATSPAPVMWDAQLAPDGESPKRLAPVTSAVSKRASRAAARGQAAVPGGVDLTLRPDRGWIDDPATVFPVTIDPQIAVGSTFDTYVREGDTAGNSGARDLQLGLLADTPLVKNRAFVQWGTTALRGKQITAATVSFYNFWSQVCAANSWEIWTTNAASSSTVWSNQPAWRTKEAASTQTKGSTGCADGWVSATATSFFQRAASANQTVAHMGIRATNETQTTGFKQFRSGNAADTAQVPKATVTYNSLPVVATRSTTPTTACATGAGRPFVASRTPQLKAKINDAEGSAVSGEFEWSTTGGTGVATKTSATAASGSTLAVTVPTALAENGSYRWRVRAKDPTATSGWSPYCEFTVDTVVPAAAPTVSSTSYPPDVWSGGAGTAGAFVLAPAGVADVASYEYGLDVEAPTQSVNATAVGGGATINLTPPSDGPHTLSVRSRDRAGNRSPVRRYAFNVGTAAVTAPQTGTKSAGMTPLAAAGLAQHTGVTYQWRRGYTDPWVNVPTGDVAVAAGGAAVTWPLAKAGDGAFAKLNWNVAQTLNNAEAGPDPLDGPVQTRAVFAGGTAATSTPVVFTLDRDRASAASEEIGPGQVNVLTGNLHLDTTDVSAEAAGADLSLSRTYNSRQSAVVDPMFGPGWVSSTGVDDGAVPYTGLTVTGSLVQVGLADGTTLGFVKKTGNAAGAAFEGQTGTESLTVKYLADGDRYTVTTTEGSVATFTRPANAAVGQYVPTQLRAAGSADTVTVSWERVTVGGTAVLRPTRVLAAVPTGVACGATLAKGCRAMTFTYATDTTAKGADPAQWGTFAGRLVAASFTAFDPAADAMATEELARYAYDHTGRLRSAWDPRLDHPGGHLADTYAYHGDGVLSELRPAGREPWRFAYTLVPGDPGAGRLASVSRSALDAGTATDTVVYRVAPAGAGAPYDMSAARTARWGQREHPVEATAVFGPDQLPDGNQAAGRAPSSYERARVIYVDADGRAVNEVDPGGHTSATWYDQFDNVVRTMTPGNIARALQAPDDTSAQLAYTLSTLNVYSGDGARLTETFGPEHDVALAGTGATVRGRQHVVTRYDEGAPAGEEAQLPTSETTSVSYVDNGQVKDADARTTTTRYDAELRTPTARIVDPSGLALSTRTAYDTDTGLDVATTNPGGADRGDTPSTRKTVYYRAGSGSGRAECDNKPHWAELPCRYEPGGQPASGPELPVQVMTYDRYQQPVTVVDRTADKVLRTARTRYDRAGRVHEVTITADGPAQAVPMHRNVYDPATGDLVRTQTVESDGKVSAEVIRGYDRLGRQHTYTDADGNLSTTTFDLLGRPATTNNGRASRIHTYDGGAERRGLLTGVLDTLSGGTFAGEYDADGRLVREVRPQGITATYTYDETGTQTAVTYERPNCGQQDCTLYAVSAVNDVHGQQRRTDGSLSAQAFDYDAAGRLVAAQSTTSAGCVTRTYAVDARGNRTRSAVFAATEDGACQAGSPTTERTHAYDSADRIVGGYAYDALGRATTVPTADTANNGGDVTVGYHSTDLVASISQGGRTTRYTLDVTGERVRSWTDTVGDKTASYRHHYDDDTDSPAGPTRATTRSPPGCTASEGSPAPGPVRGWTGSSPTCTATWSPPCTTTTRA